MYLKGCGAGQIQGLQQATTLLPDGAQRVVPIGNNGDGMPALPAGTDGSVGCFQIDWCSEVTAHWRQRALAVPARPAGIYRLLVSSTALSDDIWV